MKCKTCGQIYKSYNKNSKYCSRRCYYSSRVGKATWNKDKKTGELNCTCLVCNKKFHLKPCGIKRNRGKYCSLKCYAKIRSQWMSGSGNPQYDKHWGMGDGNPNWRGGVSREPYSFAFTDKLKDLIRERDNWKCSLCQAPQEEFTKRLPVHHIDYDKQNCSINNLITLCLRCNSRVNFNRSGWVRFFSEEVMPHER